MSKTNYYKTIKKFQKIIQFLYSKFFKYLFRLAIFTAMPRQSQSVPTNYLYFKNLIPVDIHIEKLRI